MALSKRTQDILKASLADSVTAREVTQLLDATQASFTGQIAGMTTDVTIDADVAGLAGNVTLVADSMTDIDGLILAWNTANPGNTLTLSSGLGNQVPTADITLAGGADLVPATTASFSGMVDVIDPAIVITLSGGAGGGTLSSRAKRVLKWNFCDSRAYAEFISVVEYGSGTLSDRTKRILSWVLCDRRAYLEIIASL